MSEGAEVRDIERDVQIQKLTQEIVEKYEKRISEMRAGFQQELTNVVSSLQNQKPKKRRFSSVFLEKSTEKCTLCIITIHQCTVSRRTVLPEGQDSIMVLNA